MVIYPACVRAICIRVKDAYKKNLNHRSRGSLILNYRLLGTIFLVVGLILVSMAFLSEGFESEGFIIIFPFIFGNVKGSTAIFISLMFLGMFFMISILPWFLMSRRAVWAKGFKPYIIDHSLKRKTEFMDYIITIELPNHLKKSIYLEGNENFIYLKSNVDKTFFRRYKLPGNYDLDEFDYEYEGDYLLVKLKLKRTI